MPETLILSFYPTNRSLYMGLMPLNDQFIDKNYQLFGGKFASHKKVL
ncbi:hypothetical protein GTQ43_37000 [Nostoc sp. KVJ3]|nr:hypothetical protein [Nostoc sp. KVJ3]MCW5315946.1 hypothetical protein [Nostoc sp. KVJ3]MCW5319035.1 hypothetical protein [Nostoc sp. KVJ3]